MNLGLAVIVKPGVCDKLENMARAASETETCDMEFVAAGDMIAEMVKVDSLMITRPLIQFVDDWNSKPLCREEMLTGEPPQDADPFLLAATASVVHALCDRDGLELPSWAKSVKVSPESTLSGCSVDTAFGKAVKSSAPPVCEQHGVYFEAELLNSTFRKMGKMEAIRDVWQKQAR